MKIKTTNEPISGKQIEDLPNDYYSFEEYVSRTRMLTFWYQLKEVLSKKPQSVLEVGIGSSIVSSVLRQKGIDVKTADININLKPDYHVSIQGLSTVIEKNKFDVILCARVLHHVKFPEFEECLKSLFNASKNSVVLTLPVDNFKIYFAYRITSKEAKWFGIPIPLFIKHIIMKLLKMNDTYYARLWKINSNSMTSAKNIRRIISKYFYIEKEYNLPEDNSHKLYLLSKKNIYQENSN